MAQADRRAPAAGGPALGETVMRRLDELARFSSDAGALTRLYLTPQHKAAALQVMAWMREAGMAASIDAVGNTVGRYEAAGGPGAPALLLGSHIDTVRNAGRYDGNLGVVVAIEAVAALHARGERLPFAVEVIAFGDEEGVRFPITLTGSHAVAGTFDPAALAAEDAGPRPPRPRAARLRLRPVRHPARAAPARGRAGLRGGPHRARAGPGSGRPAGRRGDRDQGRQPLHRGGRGDRRACRHRADGAAARRARRRGRDGAAGGAGGGRLPELVATVGTIDASPGAVNVIAADARFTIDIRSPTTRRGTAPSRACARGWRPRRGAAASGSG